MDDVDRFSPWFPFDAPAPTGPGIVQLKIVGELVRYPSGASAMLRYDCGASVADVVSRAAERVLAHLPGERVRWRYQALPEDRARAGLARLRARFVERFGAPPLLDEP